MTAPSPPIVIKTLSCSTTPGKIKLVLIGGELETYIRDDTSTNTAASGYYNRQNLVVTLFGDTIYLIRVYLDCPAPYGIDSVGNDCNLAHHMDAWIDLNDNGKFDEFENRVHHRLPIDAETSVHGYDLQVSIPVIDATHLAAGQHRMRIGVMRSEAYRANCDDSGYSETREYTVNIIPRKMCRGKIVLILSLLRYIPGNKIEGNLMKEPMFEISIQKYT